VSDEDDWRDDEKGTRMACLTLSFPTLEQAIQAGEIAFVDNDCQLSPTEGLRANRVLLRGERWLRGWSASELERWACSSAASDGGRHAARFVLGVWDRRRGDRSWACGTFDFHVAYQAWDDAHRMAFRRWLESPWWA
jgi:hypothetical protein